jgi:transposase
MTTKTPSKNGKFLGRPTTYDPAYCDQIVALGKEGLSRWQIASKLNIGWRNLQNWEGAHDDFRAALEEARLDALAYWEDLAHDHIREAPGGIKLNTGLWSRSMAARFPEQYRENSKVEVTGKNDGPIEVDMIHDFSQNLLDDLLATRQSDAKSSKGK